ncbi:Hypothetical predicted protein [Olea europaea subsp. europaea]|uniref:Uncharacterized protein n=1 Tax=Olea europaea subsp. europaea TaxID=158383 RepID=A0A8S0SHV6_OLEEU|nr:Hypothetical predicted protein [Olea europaea subsp. europaea]
MISTLRDFFSTDGRQKCLTLLEERASIKGKASLLAAVTMLACIVIFSFRLLQEICNMQWWLTELTKTCRLLRPSMALLGRIFLNKTVFWLEFPEAIRDERKMSMKK